MLPNTTDTGHDCIGDAVRRMRLMAAGGPLPACLILLILLVAGGCRRQQWELVSIEGTVTRAGQPLEGVEVIFVPDVQAGAKGPRASGGTDAAGRYRLRTNAGEPGAAPGLYRVCILRPRDEREPDQEMRRARVGSRLAKAGKGATASSQPAANEERNASEGSGSLPKEYAKFEKTPLRAEVKPGAAQTCDFTIP